MSDKKNVLVISSSLRKDGNSDLLCHEFAAAAYEVGYRMVDTAVCFGNERAVGAERRSR